jgi:GNAT superfamily N-acetyltransferase
MSSDTVNIEPHIRPATLEDAPGISRLISETWTEFNKHTVTPEDLHAYITGPLSPPSIASDISDPNSVIIIASQNDCLIGMAQLTKNTTLPCLTLPKPIELQRLYAASSHHGSGLGARLVRQAEALAKEQGYESLWLGVYDGNKRGSRFCNGEETISYWRRQILA